MKRVFMVIGPESAGNRVTTRLLCEAGCYGDPEEPQWLNDYLSGRRPDINEITGTATHLVYRSSVPAGTVQRPDFFRKRDRFTKAGFTPLWIFLLRDWYANVRSKVLRGHQPDERTAWQELPEEWLYIGNLLQYLRPFYILNTSYLFTHPRRALQGLAYFTGLTFPESAVALVRDEDAKYFS